MGIAAEETMETESSATTKKWVISGIQFMTPLKPIYTKKGNRKPHEEKREDDEDKEKEWSCTTPTTPESRIPALKCPGAPRKRKTAASSSSRSQRNGVRDYFRPPELELESVLLRCGERV